MLKGNKYTGSNTEDSQRSCNRDISESFRPSYKLLKNSQECISSVVLHTIHTLVPSANKKKLFASFKNVYVLIITALIRFGQR